MLLAALVITCGALVILGYGWFEAGWLRTRVLDIPVAGLPDELDGVRIAHLSDFHLGARLSRGNRASRRAAAWVAERRPDVVCVTGDLVSHPRGERRLRALLDRPRPPFVVLGNHDVAVTRDPFSRAAELHDLERASLLRGRGRDGHAARSLGVGRRRRPGELPDETGAGRMSSKSPGRRFRLLLCHFPGIVAPGSAVRRST